MKKLLSISGLAAAAALALGGFATAAALAYAGPASAADMPLKAPPAPPPAYSWTGIYVGISDGWSWEHSSWSYDPPVPTNANQHFSADKTANIFSGLVGLQWQWSNIVIGAEYNRYAAFDSSNWTSHQCPNVALNCEVRVGDLQTAGARLGWAGHGFIPFTQDWLLYVTGGWAEGTVQTRATFLNAAGVRIDTGEDSLVRQDGWFVGVGLDAVLAHGSLVDWIGGIEYDHIDLGTSFHCVVATACVPGPTGNVLNRDVSLTEDIFKFRTTLKFH